MLYSVYIQPNFPVYVSVILSENIFSLCKPIDVRCFKEYNLNLIRALN